MTNSEDSDEMPHKAAFHQGLHCLSRQNKSLEKEKPFFFGGGGGGIITCNCSIHVYTMDYPDLTVLKLYGKSHCLKRVNNEIALLVGSGSMTNQNFL